MSRAYLISGTEKLRLRGSVILSRNQTPVFVKYKKHKIRSYVIYDYS